MSVFLFRFIGPFIQNTSGQSFESGRSLEHTTSHRRKAYPHTECY